MNFLLTHWGQVTHIFVSNLTIIGSDNGLPHGQCQAVIWTNAGIMLNELLGTNFYKILIKIPAFSFKKIHLKIPSAKWQLHPITFYRIISGECAVPGLNATFCFLWFTNCVLRLFDKSLILGCLWPLVFVLNNILILGIWCSTIPHLPGCFCPWTFFENIGFNTVLTNPFMSHLATQLRYSAGEFQALQLIVLATFGVVN